MEIRYKNGKVAFEMDTLALLIIVLIISLSITGMVGSCNERHSKAANTEITMPNQSQTLDMPDSVDGTIMTKTVNYTKPSMVVRYFKINR